MTSYEEAVAKIVRTTIPEAWRALLTDTVAVHVEEAFNRAENTFMKNAALQGFNEARLTAETEVLIHDQQAKMREACEGFEIPDTVIGCIEKAILEATFLRTKEMIAIQHRGRA